MLGHRSYLDGVTPVHFKMDQKQVPLQHFQFCGGPFSENVIDRPQISIPTLNSKHLQVSLVPTAGLSAFQSENHTIYSNG